MDDRTPTPPATGAESFAAPPLERFGDAVPVDRSTLLAALTASHAAIAEAFAGLPAATFLSAQGEHWSPADHLRHLERSTRPLVRALGLPRLALRTLFGRGRGPSRSYPAMVETYHAALAGGGRASGRYLPAAHDGAADDAWRQRILERWRQAGHDLDRVLGGWDEPALDRYRLPHPLLGALTVREMLYFTLYHQRHHAGRVWQRLAA